ncbi:MAG: cytochrome C oxidase subunit IV family protein [Deltaproteobacteria bacterium]|nr:cytochrome C oxidase subunit IV family protein [Deltaproteobacteria bacterium]
MSTAHARSKREYWKVFVALGVLTLLEVGVAKMPGIGKPATIAALVLLAVAKAACVGLFYMHLRHETRVLKLTVAIPMAVPALYALVLVSEAAWRLLG